jgi:hypothetical protein
MGSLVPPSLQEPTAEGLYKSPQEALQKVSSEFEYWTGKLTETSLQMCYALIGANWVIFGSVNGILHSIWAKSSIVLVLLALASNVIGAWILSGMLRRRIGFGEGHNNEWAQQFREASGKAVPWPFTKAIENTGKWMRAVKAGFTLAAGVCLIAGAILNHTVVTPTATTVVTAPCVPNAPSPSVTSAPAKNR